MLAGVWGKMPSDVCPAFGGNRPVEKGTQGDAEEGEVKDNTKEVQIHKKQKGKTSNREQRK